METPFQYRKESRPANQQPKTLFIKIEILIGSNKHLANNFLWVAAQSNIVDFIIHQSTTLFCSSQEFRNSIADSLLTAHLYWFQRQCVFLPLQRFSQILLNQHILLNMIFFNSSYFFFIFEESVLFVLLRMNFWVSVRSCKIELNMFLFRIFLSGRLIAWKGHRHT